MRPLAFLLLVACSTPPADPDPQPTAPAPQARTFREAYTRTQAIEIDGALVGYLVQYQAQPVPGKEDRLLPEGSYRIQDTRFEDVGFITPRGEVFRHTAAGESLSLGSYPLARGLTEFFGPGPLRLRPLENG